MNPDCVMQKSCNIVPQLHSKMHNEVQTTCNYAACPATVCIVIQKTMLRLTAEQSHCYFEQVVL